MERPPLPSPRACPGASRCGVMTDWLPWRWGGDGASASVQPGTLGFVSCGVPTATII